MKLSQRYFDELERYEHIEWRLKKMGKDDWHRFWMHFPMGMFAALLLTQPKTLWIGIALAFSFLVYEIMNDWRKKDWSYKDVCGFVWGIGAVGLIIYLIGVLL